MRRKAIIGLLALVLAACAHQVILTPRDGGPIGRGEAEGTLVSYHGKMFIDLAGDHYTGEWVYSPGGAAGTFVGTSGGQVATGSVFGVAMSGPGKASVRAPGGKALTCAFNYSDMSATGEGECQSEAGKVYDLMIHY